MYDIFTSTAEAAMINKFDRNLNPMPEIMIPLVGSVNEFKNQAKLIRDTFAKVKKTYTSGLSNILFPNSALAADSFNIRVGTMIEVPRAALIAADIAKAGADFFSYGTNDLTQMTFGFSRDDVGTFLPQYLKQNILERDPFHTIDEDGVGLLVTQSAKSGKIAADKIGNTLFKAGVCGEHGGDPHSVRFFAKNGLNYVSCSPFRVPLARLAAAQAEVK
jgi:pyruvate,orthophosphate dikinase